MDKKQELKDKKEELEQMISSFCKEKLDEEYEQLCTKMLLKLYRKKNCPFERGSLSIWAASIIYTIGRINFLFDKSFEPFIPSEEIHNYFHTKVSTVSGKSTFIRNLLGVSARFDREFSTSFIRDSDPANRMVRVDGILILIDSLPEKYQQIVREARSRGEDVEFVTKMDEL